MGLITLSALAGLVWEIILRISGGLVMPQVAPAPSATMPSSSSAAGTKPGKSKTASRRQQGEAWGVFTLARIWSRKQDPPVQIGWGATCGMHCDAGSDRTCKKMITYGRRRRRSDAETRRLIKAWCVMGTTIPFADPLGKKKHIGLDLSKCTLTEEELDEAVA